MKTSRLSTALFNPFKKIAGWEALGIGLIFVIGTTFIGNFAGIYFDGVIDIHFLKKLNLIQSWSLPIINLLSVSLVMWIAGLTISKSFRFIDVLGTMTLARAPFLLISIAGLFTVAPNTSQILENPFIIFESISFLITSILTIPIIVWAVALMFNGFKISTGASGSKLILAFIVALIAAEIISKVTIYFLFQVV